MIYAPATLFLDVCVQADLWPDGVWPLVSGKDARNIARLFAIAGELELRQGGVICRHATLDAAPVPEAPMHCRSKRSGWSRPAGCTAILPMQVWTEEPEDAPEMTLDRAHAVYVDSGCHHAPDGALRRSRAFGHLTAGIRDAVVFGAGIEHGLDRVVDALLRRRIRTHVALDAAGTADEIRAQAVVACWKRRGVDGVTVAMVHRMLRRG